MAKSTKRDGVAFFFVSKVAPSREVGGRNQLMLRQG
jgi:hypothetical protein